MTETPHQDKAGEKGSQEFTPAIAFALGTINGTVENLRTDLKEWKDDVKDTIAADKLAAAGRITDLDTRVRALEKWKWMIAGAAAAGGAASGKILEILAKVTS